MSKVSLAAIIEDLKARISDAEAIERDHKNDPSVVRRELAGYTRGLKDALFVVEGKMSGKIWLERER